jgi:hypothetical protein
VKRNELFPVQRKSAVRDYLRGFVPNIDRTPLGNVSLLKVLHVPARAYTEVIERRANYHDALAILERRART